jgi:hypothetical protein
VLGAEGGGGVRRTGGGGVMGENDGGLGKS